jgi:hypothetical protein
MVGVSVIDSAILIERESSGLFTEPISASPANVADTGVRGQAQAMVERGEASDICDALAKMYKVACGKEREKVKATQKALKCRSSRQSKE